MCKRCFVLVVLTFTLSTFLISGTVDCDKRKGNIELERVEKNVSVTQETARSRA